MDRIEGACFCRAVSFTAPTPSLWVAHCHCSMCRRAHGAPVVTWVGLRADAVAIDDGAGSLRWHESSDGAERGFCSRCGSALFFRSERWPGELHIALANLDGEADRAPMAHVYWDTHVPWAHVDPADGLPRKSASG